MNLSTPQKIGFIGVGAMGTPMILNLLKAGFDCFAFDLNKDRLEKVVKAGSKSVADMPQLLSTCDCILTSLPSSDAFIKVANECFIPLAKPNLIFVDLGTTLVSETRCISSALEKKSAHLLDVPVSGGPGGVEDKKLRMFAGGELRIFEAVKPVLVALGGSDYLFYCGAVGAGQIVKGVNQLMMGLAHAAYIESVAFGVRSGVPAEIILKAVGGEGWLRKDFSGVAEAVAEGKGNDLSVKFRELPYFLKEAELSGFQLPLARTLYSFCEQGDRIVIDDNRPAPSFWNELLKK